MTAWEQPTSTFSITFWWPPPPSDTTQPRYAEIAAANFTVWTGGNSVDSYAENIAVLDLAQANGFKCTVQDTRIYEVSPHPSDETIQAVVDDYKDHPALYGYSLWDEMSTDKFPDLAYQNAPRLNWTRII